MTVACNQPKAACQQPGLSSDLAEISWPGYDQWLTINGLLPLSTECPLKITRPPAAGWLCLLPPAGDGLCRA